jgi:hypothetical protein
MVRLVVPACGAQVSARLQHHVHGQAAAGARGASLSDGHAGLGGIYASNCQGDVESGRAGQAMHIAGRMVAGKGAAYPAMPPALDARGMLPHDGSMRYAGNAAGAPPHPHMPHMHPQHMQQPQQQYHQQQQQQQQMMMRQQVPPCPPAPTLTAFRLASSSLLLSLVAGPWRGPRSQPCMPPTCAALHAASLRRLACRQPAPPCMPPTCAAAVAARASGSGQGAVRARTARGRQTS